MTVTTIAPLWAGHVDSTYAYYSWPPAIEGQGSKSADPSTWTIEVTHNTDGTGWMRVREGYLSFDTSVIPDGDEITAITLAMNCGFGPGNLDAWTVEVRDYNWGPELTTADYIPGSQLASHPLVASNPAGGAAGIHTFTSTPAFLNVPGLKTGVIYLHFSCSLTRTGDSRSWNPASNNQMQYLWPYPNLWEMPGSNLVITHEAGGPPVEEVATSLPVEIDLSGEVTVVPAVVEELTTSVGVSVALSGTLGDAPLSAPRIQSTLTLTLSLSGVLVAPTETVQSVSATALVTVALGGRVAHPPVYEPPRGLGRGVSRTYRRSYASRRWT